MPQTHFGSWDGRPVQSINGVGGILTTDDIGLGYLWTPADHGLLAWTYDPALASNTTVAVSGTKYVQRIKIGQPITVSNIIMVLPTAGNTLTSNQNGCALYDSTGVQIGVTADQTASWVSTGVKTMAITPVGVNPPYCYVEIMSNGTTPATFTRATPSNSALNVNLSGATLRNATNGTGATALDASITPGSLTAANSPLAYWVGLS